MYGEARQMSPRAMRRGEFSYLPVFVQQVMSACGADRSCITLYIDPDGVPVQSAEAIGIWVGGSLLHAHMLNFHDLIEAVALTTAHFARIPVRTNDTEREGEG